MITRNIRLFTENIMNSRGNLHGHGKDFREKLSPAGRFSQQQSMKSQMPTTSDKFANSNDGKKGTKNSKEDTSSERTMHGKGGLKRAGDDLDYPPDKKARGSEQQSTSKSQSPGFSDNFIVPVSHGTEKITMAVWNYFMAHQMTSDDLKKKLLLRKSLLSVLSGAFPNCRLFIVGSSMTGFATKTSDVDMCLMVTLGEMDQKRDATLILTSIAKALRQCSFVRQSQVIRAKVPILKFYDQVSGVECDLNVNNIIGIRNTHLLRHYAYMDWRVRPLMLFIKKWARFHDINDASKKTISSYSLSLMLIHYLQAGIRPPVLPCLQQLRPDTFSIKTDVRKLSLSLEDKITFNSKNQATLGELMIGFFNYYSNVFSYETKVISVRQGKCVPHREMRLFGDNMQWKFLNIEEPFEGSNTARSVYDYNVFMRITRVFKASFNFLENSRDVESIFSRPF